MSIQRGTLARLYDAFDPKVAREAVEKHLAEQERVAAAVKEKWG